MASSDLNSFKVNVKSPASSPSEPEPGNPTRARSSSYATYESLKSFSENFVLGQRKAERRSVDLGINLDLDKSENVSVQSTVLKMSEQNGRYKQAPDTLALKRSPVPNRETVPSASVSESKKKKRRRPPSVSAPSFEDKYKFSDEVLGSGAFAVVKTCYSKKDHLQLAAKLIEKRNAQVRPRVLKEVEILYKCKDHPNVLQLKDFFETSSHFYLVFEKMDGGPLLRHIQHQDYFTEQQASLVVCDLASALAYLHAKGIAHRDLKPENILCSAMDHISPVKICDFDLSSVANIPKPSSQATTPMLYTPVGSAEFMAPEVVEMFTGDAFAYDKKCDLWSLGVTLYIMLSGYPPFYGRCGNKCGWDEGEHCTKCQDMLMERIQDGRYEFPAKHWSQVSSEAKDLISHLLVKEVDQRYTAMQVLNHSWVQVRAPTTPLDTPKILSRNPSMTMEVAQFAARSIAFHRTDSAHSLSRQGSCELMDGSAHRRSSGLEGDVISTLTKRTNELRLSSPESSELVTRRVKSRNSDETVESKTAFFSIAD